jgi:DsbC/DsbD-like thiol-disulfide interchange protein
MAYAKALCILTVVLNLFFYESPEWVNAEPVKQAHVESELVSNVTSVQPGEVFMVALRLKIDEGWHTYWRNPGDSGLATQIVWDLPEGFEAGLIQWPHPKKIDLEGSTNYGYEGEVFLLTEMSVSEGVSVGSALTLRATASWLACQEVCVSGNADHLITLPVKDETPVADELWSERLSKTSDRLAMDSGGWKVEARDNGDTISFVLIPPEWADHALSEVYFFPYRPDVMNHSSDQVFQRVESGYHLQIVKSSIFPQDLSTVEGVLVSRKGWQGAGSNRAIQISSNLSRENNL